LDKKDDHIKERVEDWRGNIQKLTTDLKKQVKFLDDLDTGDTSHEGRGNIRRDIFGFLVDKFQKDIEELVKICQRLMVVDIKKQPGSKEIND
jgi:hypothetical protein